MTTQIEALWCLVGLLSFLLSFWKLTQRDLISQIFSLPFGQIGCNGSIELTADSIWHLFRGTAVWKLSAEFFRLMPYLMTFSLVIFAFEMKGVLWLVVTYQIISFSGDCEMAVPWNDVIYINTVKLGYLSFNSTGAQLYTRICNKC